ncbi:hypothetical protein BGZ73_006386 [Actinomortierella ambigua]|nr:hypothetical protein BGZ73_006386 [Actinomortierella ambigua]
MAHGYNDLEETRSVVKPSCKLDALCPIQRSLSPSPRHYLLCPPLPQGVPFSAGSLGTQRRTGTDERIVSLNDHRGSSADPAGSANGTTAAGATAGIAGAGKGQKQRTTQGGVHDYLMVLTSQRLPYEIQIASGWDNGYPPEELVGLMETMTGKGWHTPRFCRYPQDLVLRFSCGRCRIKTIQILSHQYKIASKLDFWIGASKGTEIVSVEASKADTTADPYAQDNDREGEEGSLDADDEDAEDEDGERRHQQRKPIQARQLPVLQFEKLGSISFDSNEYSKFSGRELRSISCDVEGEYLRVVIRRCHVNPLNIYHQAAILALNVLGEPLEDELVADSERIAFEECEIVNEPSYGQSETSIPLASPTNDKQQGVTSVTTMVESLSVSGTKNHALPVYLDTEIQQLVAGFVLAKNDAAKAEHFASAKEYKSGLEGVLKFADEIQAIDIQKQKAVKEEDFDLAQELKLKVSEAKARLDEHLAKHGFIVQMDGETTRVSRVDGDDSDGQHHPTFTASKSYHAGHLGGLLDKRNMSNITIPNIGDNRLYHHPGTPPSSSLPDHFTSSTSDSSDQEKRHPHGEYTGRIPIPHARHSVNRSPSEVLSRSYSDRSPIHMLQPALTGASPPPSQLPHRAMFERLQRRQQVEPRAPQDETLPFITREDFTAFDPPVQVAMADDSKLQEDLLLDDLTDKERRDFAVVLQVFDSRIVSCAISRELHLRLYSIEYVREYLENEMASDELEQHGDKALLARAAFQIIAAGLSDTREKVTSKVLSMLDQTIRYCLQNEVPASTVYRSLEPIFPLLLVKAADLNARVAQGTMTRIVVLCNSFRTQHFSVLPLVFRPSRNTLPYKQAQARVEIVTRLVDEFGVYDRAAGKGTPTGLDFNSITDFVIPYLNHTNAEVRMAAKKLVVDVCKFLNKTRVEHFLPGLKPLIIESIQKELEAKRSTLLPVPPPSLLASSSSHSSATTTTTTTTANTRAQHSSRSSTPSMLSKRLASSSLSSAAGAASVGNTSGANMSINKSQSSAAKIGVDLHVESLHHLLKAPDTPVVTKASTFSSMRTTTSTTSSSNKPLSDIAQAHVSRVKKPLKTSIKSTHNLPRLTSRRETAVSPDEESTTESEKPPLPLPPPMAPRTAVRPLYARSKNLPAKPATSAAATTTSKSSSLAAEGRAKTLPSSPTPEGSGAGSSTEAEAAGSRTSKDRFCVFCDEYDNSFTDDGLVAHYWNDCPMLANCPFCKIIIEVTTLPEHMLTECSRRKFIKQCETCKDIIAAEDYLAHTARNACIPIPDGAEKCPLCHCVMESTEEEAWREHLMADEGGCPNNRNRRRLGGGAGGAGAKRNSAGGVSHAFARVSSAGSGGGSSSDETKKSKRTSALPVVKLPVRGLSPTSNSSVSSGGSSASTKTTTTAATATAARPIAAAPSHGSSAASSFTSSSFTAASRSFDQRSSHRLPPTRTNSAGHPASVASHRRSTPVRTHTTGSTSNSHSGPGYTSFGHHPHHAALDEPVHPFDPAPSLLIPLPLSEPLPSLASLPSPPVSDSMASPPPPTAAVPSTHASTAASGGGGSSRIPKFGAANRSISSNNLATPSWR